MGTRHTHRVYVHAHSLLHRMAPELKLLALLGFVIGVALTPPTALVVFALDGVVLVAVAALGSIGPLFLAKRAAVVLPFVAFAMALPFIGSGPERDVLGVAVSEDGLRAASAILCRSSLGIGASVILAATTEVSDILRGLNRLRVPPVLTAIAAFLFRYLDVISGEVSRMRVAMSARGHDPRWLWQTRPIATSAGALFVRSYERGERVHAAMLARGFDGTVPDATQQPPRPRHQTIGAAVPAVSALSLAVLARAIGW